MNGISIKIFLPTDIIVWLFTRIRLKMTSGTPNENYSNISNFKGDFLIFFKYLHVFSIFKTKSDSKSRFYCQILVNLVIIILPNCFVIHQLLLSSDFNDSLENMKSTLTFLSCYIPVLNFQLKVGRLLEILELLEAIKTEDEVDIVRNGYQKTTRWGKNIIFGALVMFTAVQCLTFKQAKSSSNFLAFVTPAIQIAGDGVVRFLFLITESIKYSISYILKCHLKCLNFKLRKIVKPRNRRRNHKNNETLRMAILYHKDIKR